MTDDAPSVGNVEIILNGGFTSLVISLVSLTSSIPLNVDPSLQDVISRTEQNRTEQNRSFYTFFHHITPSPEKG